MLLVCDLSAIFLGRMWTPLGIWRVALLWLAGLIAFGIQPRDICCAVGPGMLLTLTFMSTLPRERPWEQARLRHGSTPRLGRADQDTEIALDQLYPLRAS